MKGVRWERAWGPTGGSGALCPSILCRHLRPPGPWGGGCWHQNSKPIPQTHTSPRGTEHCHVLAYCWAVLGWEWRAGRRCNPATLPLLTPGLREASGLPEVTQLVRGRVALSDSPQLWLRLCSHSWLFPELLRLRRLRQETEKGGRAPHEGHACLREALGPSGSPAVARGLSVLPGPWASLHLGAWQRFEVVGTSVSSWCVCSLLSLSRRGAAEVLLEGLLRLG